MTMTDIQMPRQRIGRRGDELHVEDMPLRSVAEQFGTPTFVYSTAEVRDRYTRFDAAFDGRRRQICYAVKANGNIALLQLLASLGAGFDIVSGGEFSRVLKAGGSPAKVVFSGVGKTREEMAAALTAGIKCFNVESLSELAVLDEVAGAMSLVAPVSLRVNPDIDPRTHPYISTGLKENKFGISAERVMESYRVAMQLRSVEVVGIDCHIGSQLTELAPFEAAAERIRQLASLLEEEGVALAHVNFGGGLGVRYRDESPPDIGAYAAAIMRVFDGFEGELVFEPGRYLMADAGVLLARVIYLKENEGKNFAVVDAAMNDLMRPALYEAWHRVEPVLSTAAPRRRYDVVGQVCETGDFLARDRELAIAEGDLLAVRSAGAYGFVMSSNYNARNRAAEVLVEGEACHLVRRRESIDDQLRLESLVTT